MIKKIGVLLPRSTHYGAIAIDLLEGLRNGLQHYAANDIVQITTKSIGFGTHKEDVYKATEQLILEEDVQLVVAYISNKMVQVIRPLIMATHKILIVLDAGAGLPQEHPSCPNIIYHSLHNALGAKLAAKYAINDGHKEAVFASCLFDGGYLHTYAMSNSFTTHGGEIVYNHVTLYKPEEFTMQPLCNFYNTGNKACTLAIFSGEYAQWFYKSISAINQNTAACIYAAPFTLEENMLLDVDFPNISIKGVVSWSSTLDNEENKKFKANIEASQNHANVFNLLTWEASQLIVYIFSLTEIHKKNIIAITKALKEKQFNTPRGLLTFNVKYNTTLTPMHEVVLIRTNENKSALNITNTIYDVNADFENMAIEEIVGITSGWFNSYVCN